MSPTPTPTPTEPNANGDVSGTQRPEIQAQRLQFKPNTPKIFLRRVAAVKGGEGGGEEREGEGEGKEGEREGGEERRGGGKEKGGKEKGGKEKERDLGG